MAKKNAKKAKAAKPAPETSKKPAAPKKAKQLKLPAEGMSRKANPEIDAAAEEFRTARDVRMEHSKAEKAAKAKLLDVAKKHGIKLYIYESEDGEELEVEYTAKTDENVTVRKAKDDDGE